MFFLYFIHVVTDDSPEKQSPKNSLYLSLTQKRQRDMDNQETPNRDDVTGKPPVDSLLESLLFINQLNDVNIARETILSGLPLINNKLTPETLGQAAKRCGYRSQIVKQDLDKFKSKLLPAIIFLNNNETYVVTKINEHDAEIVKPGNKESKNIELEELEKDYSGYSAVIENTFKLDQRTKEFSVARRKHWFWKVVQGAWGTYGEVLVASLLINVFAVAVPLFVMNVYDRVVPNNAVETLWVLSIGMLIVISFEFLMRNLRGYYIDTAGRKIDLKLSSKTFSQILGLKMGDRPSSVGSLANTMQSFESFREFITSSTISLVVDLPFAIFFVAVIAFISPTIAIVPLIAIPIIIIVSLILQKPIEHLVNESYRHAAEKHATLVETIAAPETIKCLNAEGINQRKWDNIIDAYSKLSLKVRTLTNFVMNFAISAQFLSVVAVVIVGVYSIEAGTLTIGGLIACTILNGRAIAPIVQVANLLIRYKQSKVSLNAIDQIMKKDTELNENVSYINVENVQGGIEFKNVTFSYPGQPVEAIKDVSFSIKPGEKVGIIGAAGSGKSTLLKLILKLHRPDEGHILLDDIDTAQIDPCILRKHAGYIPQRVTLFHGTIRDNVTISTPNASDDALIEAAKISGVHDFANNHPDGYDRQVGERGDLLSGGQQQSIAIARALIRDPEIFLLDEPTTSLDNARMKKFISQFQAEIKNKTLVVVTHKTQVLSLVDKLIVMDNGKLLMYGPKDQVIEFLKRKNPQVSS